MASGALQSLIGEGTVCKVSSSMGKEYGKDKMFDGSKETCWHSKEGKPQSITLRFDSPKDIRMISMQFQGGFTPTECKILVEGNEAGSKFKQVGTWFPANSNAPQNFKLQQVGGGEQSHEAQSEMAAALVPPSPAGVPDVSAGASDCVQSKEDTKEAGAQAEATAGMQAENRMSASHPTTSGATAPEPASAGFHVQALRIVMVDSTDFYGRVVVYALDVLGS